MRERLLSELNIQFEREFNFLSSARLRIAAMAGTSISWSPAIRPRCYFVQAYLVIFFMLFSPIAGHSQWRQLLNFQAQCIYFLDLPGPPRIGFTSVSEDPTLVMKTTDGGYSWKSIILPQSNLGFSPAFVDDFTFKDTLTGWLAAYGSGCYKTTDGGNSWIFVGGGEENTDGIYYDKKTDGLFISLNIGWDSVSWDEGFTWSGMANTYNLQEGGFAFSDDDNGILTAFDIYGPLWQRTTDGGRTWEELSIDSAVWQPLAISGTQTYFVNTSYGNILRTDDSWNTWREVYSFPNQLAISPRELSSSCIRGDLANLYVTVGSGCYRSTDQGITWNYLCGQPSSYVDHQRFYVKGSYIYITASDSSGQGNYLWMLNLDSLLYFSSKIEGQFIDGSKRKTLQVGDTVRILYRPTMDSLIGIDSTHFVVRYDSNALDVRNYTIPAGWSVANVSNSPGRLDLWLTDTNFDTLPNPVLTVTFGTALSTASTIVYLDSAHLYGKRMTCDNSVLSVTAPDSVEIDFTGCGDSVLLHYMHTGEIPFTIQSIQPNPATYNLNIHVESKLAGSIHYDLLGTLGETARSGELSGSDLLLDVSALPSGIYYLRLSQDGFVQSRRVVIER
jgi:photosystem II stability/assembly factor-like uncharacterized protein